MEHKQETEYAHSSERKFLCLKRDLLFLCALLAVMAVIIEAHEEEGDGEMELLCFEEDYQTMRSVLLGSQAAP